MLHDLRYTARVLRRSPGFALSVIATLALGIGATTTIYSVLQAVILRPLPFTRADRLFWIAERNDRLNLPQFSASAANFVTWKTRQHTFEDIAAIGFGSYNIGGDGRDAEQVNGAPITPSVLPVLGVQPVAGRGFVDADAVQGAPRVALISEALWRRRFARDPSAIGRRLTINTFDVEIVGVAPAALTLLAPGDVWTPLDTSRDPRRLNHVITAIGRMRPGVSIEQAQSDMDAMTRSLGTEFPEIRDWGIRLVTFHNFIIGNQLTTSLWVLMGAVGCVLLIACANIANLLLSRAVSREREVALRTSLGATRGRLVRQLLVESVLLAMLGGGLGLALAFTGVRSLNALLPAGLLPISDIAVDGGVLAFALVVTMVTGVLFGLAPALATTRIDANSALKQASRSSTGGRSWLRGLLASSELALATMLLVGAGLLGQSLVRLQQQSIGFSPDRLLTFQVSPPGARYALDAQAPVFYSTVLDALKGLPGVSGAAVSSGLPFGNGNFTTTPMQGVGATVVTPDTPIPIDWRIVSSEFFSVMNVPLIRGRLFTAADKGSNVTIISQGAARRFWGDADPVGKVIKRVADQRENTIIGVVGDVRNASLSQESPAVYYPAVSRVWPRMDLAVRTAGEPMQIVSAVRQVLKQIDPNVPISNVHAEADYVAASSSQPRLNAILLTVFAVVALVIAAVGVYGILAYSVNQRTREIGVRMALGASRTSVLALVVREGMIVGLIGMAIGVAGALALGRTVASLLFGVPAYDPTTFVTVTLVLAVVTLVACAIPATRASRVDPQVALRGE